MTLNERPFKQVVAHRTKPSASEQNRLYDVVEKMARSLGVNCFVDSTGVHTRPTPTGVGTGGGSSFKIFSVNNYATGDGVYDCYRQTLLDAEWEDTAGDYKFNDTGDLVEVLNLAEADTESLYVPHLVENDLLMAYQMTDDAGTSRWIGVPFVLGNADRIRKAWCTAPAGAATNIDCELDYEDAGTSITVYCTVAGGGNLNTAIPRLEGGDMILVTKIAGSWFCTTVFQASEDC